MQQPMTSRRRRLVVFIAAAAAHAMAAAQPAPVVLGDSPFALTESRVGEPLSIASASPASLEQIVSGRIGATVTLPAQLFLPAGRAPHPVAILVPGSGGVSEVHLVHARQLLEQRIGVLLFDPFGPRGMKNTVTDQSTIPFAASTHDVLAAARALTQRGDVDAQRLAVVGYSRGGFAAHMAVMRPLSEAVLGPAFEWRAAAAAWPYCGLQFQRPRLGHTALRFLLAERDNWASPVQCQALAGALAARSSSVSVRLFKGASHGFGYAMAQRQEPDALKAFSAPVLYVDDDGVLLDPYNGQRLPGADERAMLGMLAPFISRGVSVGPREGDNEAFMADLLGFLARELRVAPGDAGSARALR
jgi:dienelactone hydrolase